VSGKHRHHKRPDGPHIRLIGRQFEMTLKLGDGPAKPTDENSGWTTIDRPTDEAATQWIGGQPPKVAIPVYLDGVTGDLDVGTKLKRVQGLVRGPGNTKPPTFRILGPVPYSGNRFVLESIEYGDDVIRGSTGTKHEQKLLRQDLTLNVMRYVAPDRVTFDERKKGGGGRHDSKQGDTAQKVANELYDESDDLLGTAKQIAELNGIRGIRTAIPVDTPLVLP
jgi:hypothetical protein